MIRLANIENMEELDHFLHQLEDLAKNYSFKDQLNGVVLDNETQIIELKSCSDDCPDNTWVKKRIVGLGGVTKCFCEKR